MAMKKDNSAKAVRRRELAKKLKGEGNEPIVEDKISFGNALSWYSVNSNSKKQKEYALAYYKVEDKKIHDQLKKLPDWRFVTFGSVCRLKQRDQYWENPENPSTWFSRKLEELLDSANKMVEEKQAKVDPAKPQPRVITIQERIREKASEIAGEIEGEIDEFGEAGYPAKFELKTSLKGVAPQILSIIAEFYKPQLAEMQEALAGTCDQLNEGYSHMKKIDKKRYISFLEHIIQTAEQGIVSAKASRKPRVRKPKPPAMIVKHLKYKIKDDDLDLRSDDRLKLAQCTEVWVYNTKNRNMTLYVPDDGGVMSVKGTTIVGFDIVKSQSKTLRKPEAVLKGVSKDIGKRALANLWKTITTKPKRPNGRINDDTILLRIF